MASVPGGALWAFFRFSRRPFRESVFLRAQPGAAYPRFYASLRFYRRRVRPPERAGDRGPGRVRCPARRLLCLPAVPRLFPQGSCRRGRPEQPDRPVLLSPPDMRRRPEMQAAGKQPAFPGAARTARPGGRERKRRVSRARNRRGCLMSVPDWGQAVPADLCRLDFPVFHAVFPRFLGESRMAASRKAAAVSTMAAPGGTEKWKENQSPAAEAAAPSRAARMNMRRRL